MSSRHELTLEEKIQLIQPNDGGNGLSYRKLAKKVQVLDWIRLKYLQLHPIMTQLESQLTDLYLENKVSKQSEIEDLFAKKN